jgi:hypothetical protein
LDRLKTDYKDDVFTGQRKYRELDNGDGTKTFIDNTVYSQKGNKFGAKDINATNAAVNRLSAVTEVTLLAKNWQGTKPYTQTVNVVGIAETDMPVANAKIEKGAAKAVKKAAACIDGFTTANGSVTFYCNDKKPAVDLVIQLKGVM